VIAWLGNRLRPARRAGPTTDTRRQPHSGVGVGVVATCRRATRSCAPATPPATPATPANIFNTYGPALRIACIDAVIAARSSADIPQTRRTIGLMSSMCVSVPCCAPVRPGAALLAMLSAYPVTDNRLA
jgi:hypothetical protein